MLPGHGHHHPQFLVLHWLTWTEAQDEAGYSALVDKLGSYGVGYNAVWWDGSVRWMTPEGDRAYHAGGSPGMTDANGNSLGLAVPYISPSLRPRGLEGEVELPFSARDATGKTRETVAWYPPIDGWILRDSVLWAREVFIRRGWPRVCVYTHACINPQKNDIRNLGINCGVTHGELNSLFTE